MCPHLDTFRCGSLRTLGLGGPVAGSYLSDFEGTPRVFNMSGTCVRVVESLLYLPGLFGVGPDEQRATELGAGTCRLES